MWPKLGLSKVPVFVARARFCTVWQNASSMTSTEYADCNAGVVVCISSRFDVKLESENAYVPVLAVAGQR